MRLLCTPGGIFCGVLQMIAALHAAWHLPGWHACSAVLQAALWHSSIKLCMSPWSSAFHHGPSVSLTC